MTHGHKAEEMANAPLLPTGERERAKGKEIHIHMGKDIHIHIKN